MTKQEENIAFRDWFNPFQIAVINSNSAIRNNIGDLVSQFPFGHSSGINDPKHLVLSHVKDALNYIHSLKIRIGDNFAEKVNASFYQASIFDKPSGENLVFCNLLLSDGKLKIAIEQIKRNLENKEIISKNESPKSGDYYQFLLYISDVKLKILQNDSSTTNQISDALSNFSFRQRIPFQYFESTAPGIEKQPQGGEVKASNNGKPNSIAQLKQQPNPTIGRQAEGVQFIGARNLGAASTLDFNFQLPALVKQKAEDLLDLLNDGHKGKQIWNDLKGSEIVFPNENTEPFYLLEVRRGEEKVYNLLDSQAQIVSTPNWRIIPLIAEDLKHKLDEIKHQLSVNQLNALFQLAKYSENAADFLQKLRQGQFSKEFLRTTFGVAETDSNPDKIAKLNSWYANFQAEYKSDRTPDLGGIIGETQPEIAQINPKSEEFISSPNQIQDIQSSKKKNKKVAPIDVLEKVEEVYQENFYLASTENSFIPVEKLSDNFDALTIVANLLTEKRPANETEKELLSKYVGFGGLKDILLDPENNAHWDKSNHENRDSIRDIIQKITIIESFGYAGALNAVRDSILNAHYTSDAVINAIYAGIDKMGFDAGKILEPSAGIGNFVGLMPGIMRENSEITQVEIESITALINKYLYHDTKVINQGLQNASLKNDTFDLVISNIPFGDYRVFDKNFKGDLAPFQNRIHNYFFTKALNLTREGGIIAFVTSKGVMDSPSNKNLREYIEQNSVFLAAFRLPNSTFKNAGTAVVTDIIFLQKTAKKGISESIIANSVPLEIFDKEGIPVTITINEYFQKNPQNVLGTIKLGGMYSFNDFTIVGPASNLDILPKLIQDALPSNIYIPMEFSESKKDEISELLSAKFQNVKLGSIGIHEKTIYKKVNFDEFEIVKTKEKIAKVSAYLEIKENLMELIGLEYQNSNKLEVNEQRKKLNDLHQKFKVNYGPYQKSLESIIKIDDDSYNVRALTDSKGKDAKILSEPTITPIKLINNTDNIDEAIIISLYENNQIDINRIATLMNSSIENVLSLASGKLFLDPNSQTYIHHVEYLSGNVKAKLNEIKQAIELGGTQYQSNFEALELVIPKDIPTSLIEARMGSRWIDTKYYKEFIVDLLKTEAVSIFYNKSIDEYNVLGKNDNLLTIKQFGTGRISAVDLIQLAMHVQQPIIKDLISRDPDRYQVNKTETALASEKMALIKEKFEDWLYKSKERRDALGAKYNELYNTTVKRKYDGSYLNFEGLNGISLNSHQKDATWMLLQNNGGIIDHIVGSGKTFIMVAATMKMKQMGTANKPMIIALKSTVPQIVESYRKAYPFANILAPTEGEFKKENRMKLFSKIAMNDWDCVIITHDNYGMIPHESDIESKLIQNELDEISLETSNISLMPLSAFEIKKLLANLEKREKNLLARLEKLTSMVKDDTLTFQKMGIDHLMVDESQQFKNLAYVSKIKNVAGMSKQEGSKRSFNLLMACRYLQDKYQGDKGITFLSGTPISNSLVELYLLFKYLRPSKMAEMDFNTFDQWATTFANPKTDVEYTISGQFKAKTRFSEFINVPELAMLYTEVADIRNDDNLTLDKPKMKTNGYIIKSVEMDEIQKDYGKKIISFIETKDGSHLNLGSMTEGQKTAYMLIATNYSNKMSIDMRLIDKGFSYNPTGKLGMLVDNVTDIYHNSSGHLGTQLIFSDIGTPKNKDSKGTLMLDYLQDEMNVDDETLRWIYGDYDAVNYKMLPQQKLDEKLKLYLELNDNDLELQYEMATDAGGNFNLYSEVKFRLEQKGIPAEQIVFIHDFKTNIAKEKLFRQVNDGEIRVILGSTQKLGTGVNVQERNVGIHHLDVPWRPSDMEQRNGRGIRQGNRVTKEFYNNELPIFTYCTELTLDTYKYQLLHSKDFLIKQVKNGSVDPTMRIVKEMDAEGEGGNGFANIVAQLSGNKDIIEKIKLESKLDQLQKSKKGFDSEKYDAEEKVTRITNNIPKIEENIKATKIDLDELKMLPVNEENRLIFNDLDGEIFEERKELGKNLLELINKQLFGKPLNEWVKIANINGIEIFGEKSKSFFTQKNETNLSFISKSKRHYSFNFTEYGGVILNNLEKQILNVQNIYETQLKTLKTNREDLEVYKLLLNSTWPKEQELAETKQKLAVILARFNKTDDLAAESPNLQIRPANHFTKTEEAEIKILLETLQKAFPKVQLHIHDFNGEFAKTMNLNTFETNNGTIYGFQKNSEIFLNKHTLNANTAIHEFGHLWLQILKTEYPKAYQNLISAVIDNKTLLNTIANNPYYTHLKTQEQQANEALANAIGDSGEYDFMQRNDLSHKLKRLIQDFWVNLKKIYGFENKNIRDWSAEEFKRASLKRVVKVVNSEILSVKNEKMPTQFREKANWLNINGNKNELVENKLKMKNRIW